MRQYCYANARLEASREREIRIETDHCGPGRWWFGLPRDDHLRTVRFPVSWYGWKKALWVGEYVLSMCLSWSSTEWVVFMKPSEYWVLSPTEPESSAQAADDVWFRVCLLIGKLGERLLSLVKARTRDGIINPGNCNVGYVSSLGRFGYPARDNWLKI